MQNGRMGKLLFGLECATVVFQSDSRLWDQADRIKKLTDELVFAGKSYTQVTVQ